MKQYLACVITLLHEVMHVKSNKEALKLKFKIIIIIIINNNNSTRNSRMGLHDGPNEFSSQF